MRNIFSEYPKEKPNLPDEYKRIYDQHFLDNRTGNTKASMLGQMMESWMHKQVAKDVLYPQRQLSTLEIGAGGLNHLKYEPHVDSYDVIEPYQDLMLVSSENARIRNNYHDISEVPSGICYDRIISIAVLEHLIDLPFVVAKSAIMLNHDGHFRAAIPNEGTIFWKLGYRFTTGVEFRKRYGLDYEVLMRYEHINTAEEIETILNYLFHKVIVRFFGISRRFAFYCFYDCSQPWEEHCADFNRGITFPSSEDLE